MAVMMAARYPERVERLATICGPVQFSEGGLFTRWFAPRYLDVSLVAASCDVVPSWLVHLPFWWLRPSIKTQKYSRLIKSRHKPGYLERFLAADVWNHDNVDMARGVFRSWTHDLYQEDRLVGGSLTVGGEAVDLAAIRCPVAVVTGEYDSITPAPACEALTGLTQSAWQRSLRARASHIGVLSAPKVVSEVRALLAEWADAESTIPDTRSAS